MDLARVSFCILLYALAMSLKVVTFRVPEDRLLVLDSVAESQQRDRSFVINEAVEQYLSLQTYHRKLIEEGLRQDEAGDLIDHRDVRKMAAGFGKIKSK